MHPNWPPGWPISFWRETSLLSKGFICPDGMRRSPTPHIARSSQRRLKSPHGFPLP